MRLLLSLLLLFAGTAFGSDLQRQLAQIAKVSRPAVVSIHVKRSRDFAPEISEVLMDFNVSLPKATETSSGATGSGVIVASTGQVLTNYHVVRGVETVEIQLGDGRRLNADVVGFDARSDLAVLQISPAGRYPHMRLADSSKLKVGHFVMAIGNPFDFSFSTTVGVVSALGRRGLSAGEIQNFIQTDAAVNPGNSGGPLINLDGQVVGINTAIYSAGQDQNSGISFAIPSNMVKRVIEDLERLGRVRRSRIGLVAHPMTDDEGKPDGLEVTWVVPLDPAEKAGIRRGDRIIAGANEPIRSQKELKDLVLSVGVGDTLLLDVRRESIVEHVSVVTAPASVVGLGRQDVQVVDFNGPEQPSWKSRKRSVVSWVLSRAGAWLCARSSRDLGRRDLDLWRAIESSLWGANQADSIVELSGILASFKDGFTTVGVRPTGTLLLVLPTGWLSSTLIDIMVLLVTWYIIPGDGVTAVQPFGQVNKLTAFRAERSCGVVLI